MYDPYKDQEVPVDQECTNDATDEVCELVEWPNHPIDFDRLCDLMDMVGHNEDLDWFWACEAHHDNPAKMMGIAMGEEERTEVLRLCTEYVTVRAFQLAMAKKMTGCYDYL